MKRPIYATASIVTVLSVAERALGFLYRIFLSRALGAEGLGLYQIALSLFGFFLTIGTGGLPITVSRMITKSKAENSFSGEKHAVSAGVLLSVLLTVPVCLLFFFSGKSFSFLFSDDRAFPVFKILLLGLTLSSVYAVFRGYFWGNKEFFLPSVLEVAEESVMVIAGILLLKNVLSPENGAIQAAWAVLLSYIFSFTASMVCFFIKGGRFSNPKKMLKPIFNTTMPITSVRASGSLVNSAVAVLLPVMLMRAGASESEALSLFGIVTGMAVPVLFIPSTLIGSLALVLVPELSEDFYRKNFARLQKNIERGLRFSVLLSCAILPFFFAIGADVGKIAFSNATAGEIIQNSCFILLPMSLTMISTSILNALGFEKRTFVYYFLGAAVMLACLFLLPSVCGIYAYPIGLGGSFVCTAVCNLAFLNKKCGIFKKSRGQVFVQSLLPVILLTFPASVFGVICNRFFKTFLGEILAPVCTAVLLAIFLFLFYLLFGVFPKSHLKKEKNKSHANM